MPAHYGYLRRTKSEADGDHVDVFVGSNPQSELVFVIDQQTKGGRFDEHKVVIGCDSLDEAKRLHLDAYSPGWTGLRDITPLTVTQFLSWLEWGDTSQAIVDQVSRYSRARAAMLRQFPVSNRTVPV